VGEDKEAMLRL